MPVLVIERSQKETLSSTETEVLITVLPEQAKALFVMTIMHRPTARTRALTFTRN
jgi:hypothetical protein